MDFKDLSPEQQEQARACKSVEEFAELAKSFGVQLSDGELAAVAGGCIADIDCTGKSTRPQCPPHNSCASLLSCPLNCESYTPCQTDMGPIPVCRLDE